MADSPLPRLMTKFEAAEYIGVSVRTLQRYRVSGRGPRFLRIGNRIRYRESDVAAWIDTCDPASIYDEA